MSDLELTMMRRVGELNKENARLKAEVEELTGLLKASTYYNTSDEVTRLKAEVERLTKAGDWVMSHWSSGDGSDEVRFCQALLKWKNAKEGKGQP
jgi:phage host-nuclease inhibitor protein Gam